MPSPSSRDPHRDFDQEAKDARIDSANDARRTQRTRRTDERIAAARTAMQVYNSLERKNCFQYEFVALKLGCSGNEATRLLREVLRLDGVIE